MLYKILTILTLALPIPIYLAFQAFVYRVETVAEIRIDDSYLLDKDNYLNTLNDNFEISVDKTLSITHLKPLFQDFSINRIDNTSYDELGIQLDKTGVVLISNDNNHVYFSYSFVNNIIYKVDEYKLQGLSVGYKLPIGLLISIIGIAIVALITGKKMNLLQGKNRLRVWVSLGVGLLILLTIKIITDSLFDVFLVAFLSWSAYSVEYMIKNKDTAFKFNKTPNELLEGFRKEINR